VLTQYDVAMRGAWYTGYASRATPMPDLADFCPAPVVEQTPEQIDAIMAAWVTATASTPIDPEP